MLIRRIFHLCCVAAVSTSGLLAQVQVDATAGRVNLLDQAETHVVREQRVAHDFLKASERSLVLASGQLKTGEVLAKIELVGSTKRAQGYSLEFGNSKAERIDAYLVQDGNAVWHGLAGSMVPRSERQVRARYPRFAVILSTTPTTLLLRISNGGLDRIQVSSEQHADGRNALTADVQTSLLALLMAIAVYWTIVFRTTGVHYYGYYVLHLVAYSVATIFYDGYVLFYTERAYSGYFLRTISDTGWCITALAMVEFARQLLPIAKVHPRIDKLFLAYHGAGLLVLFLGFTPQGAGASQALLLVSGTVLVLSASIYVSVGGSRVARLFTLSFVPAGIGILVSEVGNLFPAIMPSHLLKNGWLYYYLGSGLQPILLALGLAALINQQRLERDHAQQQARRSHRDSRRFEDQALELESLANARSRFFAAASHDLRQPLHALGLFAATLDQHVESAEGASVLNKLKRSVDSMSRLFNSLLDVSRLDAGVETVDPSAVALQQVLREVADEFRPQAEAQGLRFSCRTQDVYVRSDIVLLNRIVRNLVSNALRYTSSGGVLLSCRRRAHGVALIQVWDTGNGMTADEIELAFEEFVQVPGTQAGGMGLGLSIVQRTADLLGHPLATRSIPGQGTVFSLEVPLTEPPSEPELKASGTADLQRSIVVWFVDNDEMVRDAMGGLLEDWGLSVQTFSSASAVLKELEQSTLRPDLMLADVDLGGRQSGLELLTAVAKSHPCTQAMITGDTSNERRIQAKELGVPLLHKPVDPAQLRSLVLSAQSRSSRPVA